MTPYIALSSTGHRSRGRGRTRAPPQQPRPLKALDPGQAAGLLAWQGMGYARAAELNRYPGPKHVLELADALELTPAQMEATQALRAQVLEQARALGAGLVAAGTELEALFSGGTASHAEAAAVLERISQLQSRLRGVHLAAHIDQRELLTAGQVERYVQLRGHDQGLGGHRHHAH